MNNKSYNGSWCIRKIIMVYLFSRLTSKHSFQALFSSVRLLQGFEMSYIFIGAHWVIHIFCTVPLSFMGFMK